MELRRALLLDRVTVQTMAGSSSYGDRFSPPVTVSCLLSTSRQLVRSQAGDQVVAEATLTLHPVTWTWTGPTTRGPDVDPLAVLTPDSKIAAAGRESRVLTVKPTRWRGQAVAVTVTTT